MTRVVGGDCVFSWRWKCCSTQGFTRRFSADLSRLCWRWSPQFKVKGKVNIKIKGSGRGRPLYTGRTNINGTGLCPVDSRGRMSPHGLLSGCAILDSFAISGTVLSGYFEGARVQ
jgi:hypothetical protein